MRKIRTSLLGQMIAVDFDGDIKTEKSAVTQYHRHYLVRGSDVERAAFRFIVSAYNQKAAELGAEAFATELGYDEPHVYWSDPIQTPHDYR